MKNKIHQVKNWKRKPIINGRRQEMFMCSYTIDGVHITRHLTRQQLEVLKICVKEEK